MRGRRRRALPVLALCASFCAGVLVDGWLRTYGPPKPSQAADRTEHLTAQPPAIAAAPAQIGAAPVQIEAAPVQIGPSPGRLRLPIDDIDLDSLKGGFAESRDRHSHEAVDIVAPRGTPVHAVRDGTIAKLFLSKPGGITIYQFDPDARRSFYYAHLDRYADGLHEGQHVSGGEVIGYVGTSGNAPPGTPHLHFAIFELDADRKWWHGRPLDPFLVFKGEE